MKTSILFIEDDAAAVESVISLMKRNHADDFSTNIVDFDAAANHISDYNPDIVILDLMNGDTTNDPQGIGIHNALLQFSLL